MKMVFVGDLHLTDDSGRGGLANYIPDADEYVMSEVERVVDWAVKKGCEVVVFEGDISENPRMSYAAHLAFTKTIRKYPKMLFITILGNHDKLGRDSSEGHSMQLIADYQIKNLRVITEDKVGTFGKIKVKFCPWPSTKFDSTMLNVGHTEVKGSKSDSGRVFDDEELANVTATVLMGHLHTPHSVRKVHYTGTLYQTNFGEPKGKGFHFVEWHSNDDFEITHVPFKPKYTLHNCVVETQDDIKALPRDATDLIKLVVKDGADVVVPDWPNIVITKVFKTKTELVDILTEDLLNGQELEIKTSDFFREWLASQAVPQSLKKRASRLRKRILKGNK